MKKVLALTLAIVMVATIAIFAGCGENSTQSNGAEASKDSAKTYVIYSDNAFAPFEYLDEKTNEYIGVDMEIMDAVAKDQGFEYEMHNEGFDASMGAVQAGQADAMIAGMTITDERKETFDFSDAYFDDGQVLVVKPDSDIKSLEDLKDKKVACKTSTVSGEYAESIKDKYGFEITYFEGSDTMYQAVVTGSADACVEDFSVIGYAIKDQNVKLNIVTEPVNVKGYGFAVKKGQNAELVEKFNKGLANIKKSGEYDKILEKYGY